MCLLTFRIAQHPAYKLVLAANRDEKYLRPAQAAHFWDDPVGLLAGKDLMANGTWLGIQRQGKLAALTNCHDLPDEPPEQLYETPPHKRSRGELVINYFRGETDPQDYIAGIRQTRKEYEPFNLLFGTVDQLYHYNSRDDSFQTVSPGTHSLSNATLDTAWPKVQRTREQLDEILQAENDCTEQLFRMMRDQTPAPDEELPNAPLSLEQKRAVTAPFIVTEEFGTRNTTLLLVSHANEVTFIERTYFTPESFQDQQFRFQLE